MKKLLQLGAGLSGALLVLCLAVVLTVSFRGLYYHDIRALNIAGETGLSEQTIKHNYDVLIDYNLVIKHQETLKFPDFPMSEHGRIHFQEVRRIFFGFQYGAFLFAVLFAVLAVLCIRRSGDYLFLRICAVTSLVIPGVFGLLAAVSWERLFIGFHQLVFNNDYWLFDPATDPVINILPDAFFLHCGICIALLVLIGSAVSEVLFRLLRRRKAGRSL